jgi:hypothetical protein
MQLVYDALDKLTPATNGLLQKEVWQSSSHSNSMGKKLDQKIAAYKNNELYVTGSSQPSSPFLPPFRWPYYPHDATVNAIFKQVVKMQHLNSPYIKV